VSRSKKLQTAAAEERRKHPGATVEVWAMDEHRIGLKPITRGVWAPIGERPIALGHHRFEWLYVTGFVEPASGRTVWNVSNAVCKEMFGLILADFAKAVGAGARKRIVLQLDNAGWHGPRTWPRPTASASSSDPPTPPNCSRPSICGPSSTNRSPTAASRQSRASTRRSAIAASPCPAARHYPKQHAVPLVATSASAELISRRWYQWRASRRAPATPTRCVRRLTRNFNGRWKRRCREGLSRYERSAGRAQFKAPEVNLTKAIQLAEADKNTGVLAHIARAGSPSDGALPRSLLAVLLAVR
jgi:DDE superfamily endonuclease